MERPKRSEIEMEKMMDFHSEKQTLMVIEMEKMTEIRSVKPRPRDFETVRC